MNVGYFFEVKSRYRVLYKIVLQLKTVERGKAKERHRLATERGRLSIEGLVNWLEN